MAAERTEEDVIALYQADKVGWHCSIFAIYCMSYYESSYNRKNCIEDGSRASYSLV